GHGMLNSVRSGVSQGVIKALLPADRLLPVKLHDSVVIEMPERGFLRAAWMLYAMPLLMTIFAALFAEQVWTGAELSQAAMDLRVTLAAMTGLAVGLLIVRVASQKMGRDPDMQPRVTGIN
ncbi:MAG: SoxR reducing system RseC family protein, partial [Congregibacter sp.]|nr:SoxR reducing system RseC family protein [Congregibacter sp.]